MTVTVDERCLTQLCTTSKLRLRPRLHFSLLDFNGALGRVDGGFGLAIAEPNFQIIAERATRIDIATSVYRDRAVAVLQRFQKALSVSRY